MSKVIHLGNKYTGRIETVVQGVKSTIKPELWNKVIKERVKALRKSESVVNEPENTFGKITDEVRLEAKTLQKGGIFISKFTRLSEPVLDKISVCIDSKCLSKTFIKGMPIGVLVAFLKDRKILIGWSVYNKNHETAVFTKKDAIRIAILRALTDGILTTKSDSGRDILLTKSDTHIPKAIGKEFTKFLIRARKYYGRAMVDNLRTSMQLMDN